MGYLNEVVRNTNAVGNVGTLTSPVLNAVSVGRTIILCVNAPAVSAVTSFSATDTKGNTWNQRVFAANTTLSNGQMAILVCHVTTALTTSDTISVVCNTRTPQYWDVLAAQFDDLLTSAATDQTLAGTSGSSTSLTVGPTGTTTQANELVVACFALTGEGQTVTPGTGYTAQPLLTASPGSSPKSLIMLWKYVTATGAQTATATISGTSQSYIGGIVTLKQAAAPTVYERFVIKSGAWSPATAVFG